MYNFKNKRRGCGISCHIRTVLYIYIYNDAEMRWPAAAKTTITMPQPVFIASICSCFSACISWCHCRTRPTGTPFVITHYNSIIPCPAVSYSATAVQSVLQNKHFEVCMYNDRSTLRNAPVDGSQALFMILLYRSKIAACSRSKTTVSYCCVLPYETITDRSL